MGRTYAYFISLLLILFSSLVQVHAQDTILFPLKIRVGLEVSGPAIYFTDKNTLSAEGYLSADINEKASAVLGAGYLDYKYSRFNDNNICIYEYLSKGAFVRAGVDFNLLKPKKSQGIYWAIIGLRYGLSVFTSEVPSFQKSDYWGTVSSSIAPKTYWGHFIEVSPGARAEVFRNFSIGWSVSLRRLLYIGTGKDLRSINLPGFGNSVKPFSAGLNYFIVWNIPYKKKSLIIKKEEPEETEESDENGQGSGK